MDNTLKLVKRWLAFAGGVLIVAILYWAQAVLSASPISHRARRPRHAIS